MVSEPQKFDVVQQRRSFRHFLLRKLASCGRLTGDRIHTLIPDMHTCSTFFRGDGAQRGKWIKWIFRFETCLIDKSA